jgi:hypothetical protein
MEVIGNKKHSVINKDPEFSLQKTRELYHRIFINHNAIGGIIFNEGNKVLSLYNHKLRLAAGSGFPVKKINDLFTENEYFNPPYKETRVYISGNGFTLVPSSILKSGDADKLLSFNYQIREEESVKDEHIPSIDSNIIYAYNKDLFEVLNSRFSNIEMKHFASLQIPFYIKSSGDNKPYLYCQLYQTYFQITIIDKGKLILYNHFNYSTAEDLLYYIVFCMEQLGLNPEFTKLRLSGEHENDDIINLLKDYIRDVETQTFEPKFHSKAILSNIKLYMYLPQLITF